MVIWWKVSFRISLDGYRVEENPDPYFDDSIESETSKLVLLHIWFMCTGFRTNPEGPFETFEVLSSGAALLPDREAFAAFAEEKKMLTFTIVWRALQSRRIIFSRVGIISSRTRPGHGDRVALMAWADFKSLFRLFLPYFEILSLWTHFGRFKKGVFNIKPLGKILKLYFIISHELVCDFTFKSWFFKFGENFENVIWDFES